jgi:hypothetical protein
MNAPDLDRLLGDLRASAPRPPQDLTSSVMSRLGPSAAQVRKTLWAGAAACLLSMFVAAVIALSAASGAPEAAPPELTLLTRGAGPLASL